jgi:uncharacterized membrane protein YgdD (TMEM256/DUF423 family)
MDKVNSTALAGMARALSGSPYWKIAALSGAAAVALGAFGAHGLRRSVEDPHLLEVGKLCLLIDF